MPSHHQPPPGPVHITVVESEACHFCEDARHVIAELAGAGDMVVEALDVRSETGQRLVQIHRASMSPLVLVDGEFFSHGRLPARKLARLLRERQTGTDARVG